MSKKTTTELRETALLVADLMPIFAVKFIKNAERKMKDEFSPLQLHTLFALSCEGKLAMSELARLVIVSKQQLTPIVDKLTDLELVVREHDQADRRNVTIRLSDKGRTLLDEKRIEMSRMIGELLGSLPEEDIDVLNRSAREIANVLHKLP